MWIGRRTWSASISYWYHSSTPSSSVHLDWMSICFNNNSCCFSRNQHCKVTEAAAANSSILSIVHLDKGVDSTGICLISGSAVSIKRGGIIIGRWELIDARSSCVILMCDTPASEVWERLDRRDEFTSWLYLLPLLSSTRSENCFCSDWFICSHFLMRELCSSTISNSSSTDLESFPLSILFISNSGILLSSLCLNS